MTDKRTSPHILSTSTNLLGFCLFVITALHVTNKAAITYIDEAASGTALFLAISSLLSFFSIRLSGTRWESKLELIADYLFITALIAIIVLIAFIMLNYI